jgi:hypothetical protein
MMGSDFRTPLWPEVRVLLAAGQEIWAMFGRDVTRWSTTLVGFVRLTIAVDSRSVHDTPIAAEQMRQVFEQMRTSHKFGIVLRGENGQAVDWPSVFRHQDRWYFDTRVAGTWCTSA